MPSIIKICGLSTAATLEAALDATADMVGFVFFPASPRHVSLQTARDLGARVKGRARKVALLVDADDADIADVIDALKPDMLQLHGRESIARLRDVRQRFGLPVMKAMPVGDASDLAKLPGYADAADAILFDAKPPKDATRPGGLGMPFDWTLLSGHRVAKPVLVSGGLHAGNVAEALRVTGAGGVDVSSGVETSPGVKDEGLIRAFVAAARQDLLASGSTR